MAPTKAALERISRKNLYPWLEAQELSLEEVRDSKTATAYLVKDSDGNDLVVVAIQKKQTLGTFRKETRREEVGIPNDLWQMIQGSVSPVKLVACFDGKAYPHKGSDMTSVSPSSCAERAPHGLVWFPLEDFQEA